MDDILDVVKVEIVVQHHLGCLVHSVEAIVTNQKNIELQICALLLVLDVR